MSMPDTIQHHKLLEQAKDSIASEVYSLVNKVINQELPETAQLQHLLTIACGTDSFEEVSIFIEYQGARDRIKIAQELLRSIQKLTVPDDEQFSMQKVRLFFGYLHQYMRYVKEEQKRLRHKGDEIGRGLARGESSKSIEKIEQLAKMAQSVSSVAEFRESLRTFPDKSSISGLLDEISNLIDQAANPQMWQVNSLLHSAREALPKDEINKGKKPKTGRGR